MFFELLDCYSTGIDMVRLWNALEVLLAVGPVFFIFYLRLAFNVYRAVLAAALGAFEFDLLFPPGL